VTPDAHAGLIKATAANLPGASWQRCRTHYAANLMSATPKSMWLAVKAMLHSVYDQPDAPAVQAQFDRLLDYVRGESPRCLRPPRPGPLGRTRLHSLPRGPVRADLVQQPERETQSRDPPPYRHRRHLPDPGGDHPARRSRPRRAARRMGRRPPLPRPRHPRQEPPHPCARNRRRGERRPRTRPQRLTRTEGPAATPLRGT
jgi:hypothetical protein